MRVPNHCWYKTCGTSPRCAGDDKRPARQGSGFARSGFSRGEHGMKRVCETILATARFLITCVAHAAPVTFFYTGHLTQIASLDPESPFPDSITDNPSNPTTFSGSFTFNSLALDNIPADPTSGSYASVGGPFQLTLALGGLTFDFGGVSIGVLNNYPFPVGDQYQVLYFINPTDDNPTGIQLSIQLTDLTGTAFTGDSLPLTAAALSAYTVTNFFFMYTIAGYN